MSGNKRKQYFEYETSIFDGVLYFEDCSQAKIDTEDFTEIIDHKTVNSIRLFSLDHLWCESVWIDSKGFQKELIDTELTLRSEVRSRRKHWYAYRRVLTKLHKRYIGDSSKVTQERLLEVCRAMPTTKIGLVKA
jgi:hypothetical protein